jgi:hypothetical protein
VTTLKKKSNLKFKFRNGAARNPRKAATRAQSRNSNRANEAESRIASLDPQSINECAEKIKECGECGGGEAAATSAFASLLSRTRHRCPIPPLSLTLYAEINVWAAPRDARRNKQAAAAQPLAEFTTKNHLPSLIAGGQAAL